MQWESTCLCLLLLAAQAQAGAAMAAPAQGVVTAAQQRPAVMSPRAVQAVMLGAAKAGARIVAVGERGIILTSDDNGGKWRQASVPTSVTLTAIRFSDAQHGVAVGHAGVVLITTDGGTRWRLTLDGQQIARLALASARARNDAAALRVAGRLAADGADKPLLDVCLLGDNRMLAVGAYGLAFGSDDAGKTWTAWMDRLANPTGLHLNSVRQRGDTILIAGERGLALLSTDGGRQFHRLTVPYTGSFFTSELTGDGAIVLAGLRGNVWRSSDAGRNWRQLVNPIPVSVTASSARPDGAVLLASQAGVLLTLDAAGTELVRAPAAPLPSLTGILPLDNGALLALTVQGLISVPAKAAIGSKP
jgi:photosystem II stability/assembly factor-like uncharacterized protein